MGIAAMVGTPVKRREDPRLITGQATYVDDIKMHVSIASTPRPPVNYQVLSQSTPQKILRAKSATFPSPFHFRLILTRAWDDVALSPRERFASMVIP